MATPPPGPLSIVIPALNAAPTLAACLGALAEGRRAGLIGDVLVVDGGSTDTTVALATAAGAGVLTTAAGRGEQLAAGAARARGDWLLFLHADTSLAPGWAAAVQQFIGAEANRDRAAVFRLALDDADPRARRIERGAAWRGRTFGLPYGDQGLVIRAAFYRALGGYRSLPLMEDVDLVRRIGRHRLTLLAATAVSSAARYRRGGWWLRPARNLTLLALYGLGVPPRLLLRLYD